MACQFVPFQIKKFALVIHDTGMIGGKYDLFVGIDFEFKIPLGVHLDVSLGEIMIQHIRTLGLFQRRHRKSRAATDRIGQGWFAQRPLEDIGASTHHMNDGFGSFGHVLIEPSLGIDKFSCGVVVSMRSRSQLVGDNDKRTVPRFR